MSRIFHHPTGPHLDELGLSRTVELAAAALGDHDEPIMRSPRGSHVIPNRQRLGAVAVLGERELHLSALQPSLWSMLLHGGSRSRMVVSNLPTHCLLRVVARRSPQNTLTLP